MVKRLNFGCGKVYKEGWVNADIAKNIRTDVLLDGKLPLPFKDGEFDEILVDNVLEHFEPKEVLEFMKEFHRILCPGGKLEIYVPHFTGILVKYRAHYKGYGVNSWCDERDMFRVEKEELLPISRCSTAGYVWLRWLNGFKFLFNCCRPWQQVCEKFWPGGFEEIHFILKKEILADR